MAAAYFHDLCLFAEWHPCRNALLDTVLNERPRESLSVLGASHVEVSASCDIIDFDIWLAERFKLLRLEDILIVPKTKLASIVATPNDDIIGLLDEQEAPVLDSYGLLDSHSTLICDLHLLVPVYDVFKVQLGPFD